MSCIFCVGSSFAGFCVFAVNPEEGERTNGNIADQIIIVALSGVVAFPALLITVPDMDKSIQMPVCDINWNSRDFLFKYIYSSMELVLLSQFHQRPLLLCSL